MAPVTSWLRIRLCSLRLPIAAALILVLSLELALAPGAAALPRKKDRWIRVDTAHFTLFSNASRTTATGVGADLEQFRAVLARLTSGEVHAPIPTLVYVFGDDRTFRPYRPLRDGRPIDVGGTFQPRRHANYIRLNAARRREMSESVYTLFAFHFLRHNRPGLPLWFRRGLAEYYGTMEIWESYTDIGKPAAWQLRPLREDPKIRLAELFAAEKHPGYGVGGLGQRFDAQCWAVVHYLLTGDPERHQRTNAFISQVMTGMPQAEAFERAFETTYADMERELWSYVRSSAFGYRRFKLARTGGEDARVEPLTHDDVLYRLGDLLASEPEPRPEAAEHFQATLRAHPEHGLALAGLGYLAEREGRHEVALEHYRRAAALTPDDYLIQYRYAASLLRKGDGSRAPEAREALERSIAANPDFAPARELLENVVAQPRDAGLTAQSKER